MKKKQIIIYIIILVIVGSIIGIISYNVGMNGNNNSKKEDKKKIITQEELAKYTTELHITTDNWKDYIELEDKEEEQKDAFGDVTAINKFTYLKFKDGIYGYLTMKYTIKNGENEKTTTFCNAHSNCVNDMFNNNISYNGDIMYCDFTTSQEEMKCIKIQSKVYTIDLPNDIWEINSDGKEYIMIETSDIYKENVQGENEYCIVYKESYLENLGSMVYMENM